MMLRSQPRNIGEKVSMREFMQRNPDQQMPRYPPNHIESDDEESVEPYPIQAKQPPRTRKKIFNRDKHFSEATFQQLNSQATKKHPTAFSIENTDQFVTASFIKGSSSSFKDNGKNYDGQLDETFKKNSHLSPERTSYFERNSSPSFASIKNSPPLPPQHLSPKKGQRNINNTEVSNHLSHLQTKVKEHENQIKNLNDKFHQKCMQDHELEKTLVDKLQKNQKSLYRKQQELQEYVTKIANLKTNSNLQTQKLHLYELEIQRAKRLQELSAQNEKLYQDLIKIPENQPSTTLPHARMKDQYFRSISQLQPIRDQSMDNNTIGQLLSPLLVNPNHL